MISHSSPFIEEADILSVRDQLLSNNIANGKITLEFENQLALYTSLKYCYTTANGTNAIYLALKSLTVDNGDEVILPCYVCKNVYDAVLLTGATPVLCDIGPFWCINKETVAKVISSKTKVIIAVHTMGIKCDIDSLASFRIPIIEDACQFFSPLLRDHYQLSVPHIVVFSFNGTKCLSTGEGGCLATSNLIISDNIKALLQNKALRNPLSDIQSALGLSQLKKYSFFLEKRKQLGFIYLNELPSTLTDKFSIVRDKSIYFRFLIDVNESNSFEDFRSYMESHGVLVRRGVDKLLSYDETNFGESLKTYKRTISLPIYPSLTSEIIHFICKKIKMYEFN